MTVDRDSVRLALGFATLHGLLALVVSVIPWSYGTVGSFHVLNDVDIYYDYATRALGGEIPYRDYRVEYPLFAFPLIFLPRLYVSSFSQYRFALGLEMIAADGLAIFLVARILGRELPERAVIRRLLWYTLAFSVLLPLAACRFDLAVMAWTFAAATAWSTGRPVLGGLLAGTGTLAKIVPGVAVFPAFVRALGTPGERRGVVATVGSVVVGTALWLLIGGANVADSFGYHIERGVEIGSVYSGFLLVAAVALGAPAETAYRHNSLEVVTPWSEAVARLGFPLQALALVAVGWMAWRARGAEPLRYAGAAVLAFVAFGKVLSPQYLIWLIPFIACLPGRLGSQSRHLYFLACLITTLIFPLGFHWMLQFRNWAIGLLVYRNLLLLKLWYDLTFSQSLAAPGRRGSVGPAFETQPSGTANFAVRSVQ